MGHPDDDDKTVYLEYHNAEIRKRDARIAELERELAAGDALVLGAMYLIERWGYTPLWLGVAERWLSKRPGLPAEGPGKCKREGCNEPLPYPGAVYCGAACCALAEAGE